jgi:carboxypeptidase Taq
MENKLTDLKARLAEWADLGRASAVLGWDQQTYMPPGGAAARAQQLALLRRLAHERFTDDALGHLLADLSDYAARLPYDSDDASLIRVTKCDYDKARKVPPKLVAEMASASAQAFQAWQKAKAESRFADFAPFLQRNLELRRELAKCLGYTDRIYDPLLDQFEPGMKTAQIEAIFADVRKEIVPLVHAIAKKTNAVDDKFLRQSFAEQKQWDLGIAAVKLMGYEFERGRQDRAPHPFTTSFALGDVRITTRFMPKFFNAAFFATMHEGGHALYNQGTRPELERTTIGGAASLGVHESQSRMWENMVGRSRAFWNYFMPHAKKMFPKQFQGVSAEKMYRAVNRVQPSLIRVEADEVTYNLHIMLRFELENALLEDRVKVDDLPAVWNTKMQEYLGVTPPNDAQGVLQDIHWSYGTFGYFPTYSLGNFFAAQLFDKIKQDLPDLEEQFERGNLHVLLDWLHANIHTHGRKFTLDELANRVTGESLQTRSFVAYLKTKFKEIYKV